MIIVRLRGGLGNQLFQYATGKALAIHYNVPMKIDDYTFQINNYRKIELGKFNTNFQIASRKEVHRFTGDLPITRIFHKLTNYRYNGRVFAQPHYHFTPKVFSLPSDIYLSGYWQSEKFFKSAEHAIYEMYKPVVPLGDKNDKLAKELSEVQSVSVHIRRGDFVSNKKYAEFFGTLADEYYDNAFNYIKDKIDNPHFFVFSNDPTWCKAKFSDIPNFNVIDYNKADMSFADLWLMSRCRHNIIANSSFSWWGAWLNPNREKIVVASKKWLNNPQYKGSNPVYHSRYYDTKDLLPESWIKI